MQWLYFNGTKPSGLHKEFEQCAGNRSLMSRVEIKGSRAYQHVIRIGRFKQGDTARF